jgi:nucleotide-binding universal stress UspA family protein
MAAIVLATDGSEYARTAAEQAISLAAERDATLHVVCVVDKRQFDEPALSSSELATIYAEDHAAVCVREVERMAAGRDVPIVGDARHGVPHELILEYADEVDAELILVGEHGDHERHFAGVGDAVRDRADCEVRVVTASS